jgi:hypothetical protein
MLEITNASGQRRTIRIDKFKAMDGWDIQQKFMEFAASLDKQFRREYTLEVLRYAYVLYNNVEYPLTTEALIDNHLQSWQNVQIVFEAVLLENGIDPKTHADKPAFWSNAGAEMAISFIAEATKLFGPAMKAMEKAQQEEITE